MKITNLNAHRLWIQFDSIIIIGLMIYLRKGNVNPLRSFMENSTTIGYFYYASIQTPLHRTEVIDANQWTPTLEYLNNSFHSLHSCNNDTSEVIWIQPVLWDWHDHWIIHPLNNQTLNSGLHLHSIYFQLTVTDTYVFTRTIVNNRSKC